MVSGPNFYKNFEEIVLCIKRMDPEEIKKKVVNSVFSLIIAGSPSGLVHSAEQDITITPHSSGESIDMNLSPELQMIQKIFYTFSSEKKELVGGYPYNVDDFEKNCFNGAESIVSSLYAKITGGGGNTDFAEYQISPEESIYFDDRNKSIYIRHYNLHTNDYIDQVYTPKEFVSDILSDDLTEFK